MSVYRWWTTAITAISAGRSICIFQPTTVCSSLATDALIFSTSEYVIWTSELTSRRSLSCWVSRSSCPSCLSYNLIVVTRFVCFSSCISSSSVDDDSSDNDDVIAFITAWITREGAVSPLAYVLSLLGGHIKRWPVCPSFVCLSHAIIRPHGNALDALIITIPFRFQSAVLLWRMAVNYIGPHLFVSI